MGYSFVTAKSFIEKIAAKYHLSDKELKAAGGNAEVNETRKFLIHYLYKQMGVSYNDIAVLLNRSIQYLYLMGRTSLRQIEEEKTYYYAKYLAGFDAALSEVDDGYYNAMMARRGEDSAITERLAEYTKNEV